MDIAKTARDQSQWLELWRRYKDAESMVKWYRGDIRYPCTVNEKGDKVQNTRARPVYNDVGYIRKLLGEATRLREASNLGAKFLQRTFGNFDKRLNPHAFEQCHAYACREDLFDADGKDRNSLILSGGVGTGKTHLAAAIANHLVSKGIPVLFGTFGEHLEKIKEEFDVTDRREYLSKMKSTPMLVLDDVGKENSTDWSKQILFDVINYRYEHKYPFVITTNLNDRDLRKHIGEALYSRACEICGMVITGDKDQRRNQ